MVIRRRIEAQKARFHANDNIVQFIQPGELEGLIDEVAEKMQSVLESLVIYTENDHNTKIPVVMLPKCTCKRSSVGVMWSNRP